MSNETNTLDILQEVSIDEIQVCDDTNENKRNIHKSKPRNGTRKIRHEEIIPKKKAVNTTYMRIIEEGKLYFKYMIHNFESMITNDRIEKSFDLFDVYWGESVDDIKDEYFDEIKKEFIHWVQNEYNEGRLNEHINWKTIREYEVTNRMFLGYKKMFQYKNHYFQLALINRCYFNTCKYCSNKKHLCCSHFELLYYGWTDDNSLLLQPDNEYSIPSDKTVPRFYSLTQDCYWN